VLSRARVFIGHDSGPMHIAAGEARLAAAKSPVGHVTLKAFCEANFPLKREQD